MAVLRILEYPDKRLREKALPVDAVTPEIQRIVDDMAETMYAAPGVGLAANQVGILLRIFVIDTATEDEPSDLKVFINPEIKAREGEVVWQEGCLSFPGVTEGVERAEKVCVVALDRNGTPFELEADGLLAVAIQHESEHLDGKLMIDRLGPLKKRLVQRKMQKRADGRQSTMDN
jgi:peptide deformylase